MSVYRNIGFGLVLMAASTLTCYSQADTSQIRIKENLISDSLVWHDLSACWAVIVLSKDECSNCSKSLHDLIVHLQETGRDVLLCRVTDLDMMSIKKDELAFLEMYEGIEVLFLPEKHVEIKFGAERRSVELDFKTTPGLIVNEQDDLTAFKSKKLMDNYGRMKIGLEKIPNCID